MYYVHRERMHIHALAVWMAVLEWARIVSACLFGEKKRMFFIVSQGLTSMPNRIFSTNAFRSLISVAHQKSKLEKPRLT